MTGDRFDDFLRDAARDHHPPPDTPREEIWARIQATRLARDAAAARALDAAERLHRRRFAYRPLLALAAVLMIGVAIGRLTLSRPAPPAEPGQVAGAAPDARAVATRLAAVEHFSRVEVLLTEYQTGAADAELQAIARDLLLKTRLWIDADRLDDPRLERLLEDLELILIQIAQLAPDGRADERALIDEGLAERQIRPRLRNAIPAGPAA